ncbi:Crp/Fnr family transcriptional regulator [Rhizobium deserti]|uniref:Crp/Fnr family transcriptional regulator n=1 Tax=Rhizobium deserti TaxID=2547961 RepID=A0A4V3APL1_9HYPH|nr:Crp/Fnr family transcriptional regulator [Rhizobium deserti]TDK37385.1 Crp/Fnr family transcriptional regulator [Rhizobium deserti]
MLLNDEVQLLRKVPYFCRVDPCKLKLLAFTSDRVLYEPGQVLFTQGESSDAAYVILHGTVDLLTRSSGEDLKIGEAGCNSIIGEMCLISNSLQAVTARAATEVEALRITKDTFFKVIADNPRMSLEISRTLAENLRGSRYDGTNRIDHHVL